MDANNTSHNRMPLLGLAVAWLGAHALGFGATVGACVVMIVVLLMLPKLFSVIPNQLTASERFIHASLAVCVACGFTLLLLTGNYYLASSL